MRMPFRHGSISYARLRVDSGRAPKRVDDAVIDALREHAIEPESCGNGVAVTSGWIAGRHLLDLAFDHEANAFDGALLASMRTDSVAVPAAMRRAYRAQAEAEVLGEGAGRGLSSRERMEAKERAEQRWMNEVGHGLWRRHAERPILWDLSRGLVLGSLDGESAFMHAKGLFQETFLVGLARCGAGAHARHEAEAMRKGSELRDIHADGFVAPPSSSATDAEGAPRKLSERPEPSWAAGEPLDYLGNVFLLWLWWQCECHEGIVDATDEDGRAVEVAVVAERLLDLECSWGVGGAISLRGDAPTRMPEATRALQSGKVPRKMGFAIAAEGRSWHFALQGDRLAVSLLALERPEEPPKSRRELEESRVESTLSFDRTLGSVYRSFVSRRVAAGWPAERSDISRWITQRATTRVIVPHVPLAPTR